MSGDHCCPVWMGYVLASPLRKVFQNPAKVLESYFSSGMTGLDLGCGLGFFSLPMARMAGPTGRVIAVDVQEKMLKTLRKRADRAGLLERIETLLSAPEDVSVSSQVDFALAMWMVHETPDEGRLFSQVRHCLKPAGRLLVAEPKRHIPISRFERTLEKAGDCGLRLVETPRIGLSHAAVMTRA
ncbi:MAG: class I SAM-dependent methyltransferase [bacterium]